MNTKLLRFKELRGKRTQAYVAQQLNIKQQTYRNYECGDRQADYDMLIKMANYFETTIDYMLGIAPDSTFTTSDYVSGVSDTQKESITAIEMLALETIRQIGANYGEQGQERAIEILKLAFAKGE